MLAAKTRSGLVETVHDGALAVVSADGHLIAASGDIDRPFYLRSAVKPFTAAVAQDAGALLRPVEMALAAASHDGHPVHVAVVRAMLEAVGLDETSLRCPEDWPLDRRAALRLARAGHERPRRIWHNCSGQHASWLRASQAQGWAIEGYLSPGHPMQAIIRDRVGDLGSYDPTPVGVDGCGAPVLRTTCRAMALLFASLASATELRSVFVAMHRYPALVSGHDTVEAAIATATNAVAKRGAEGCLGVAVEGRLGVAAKSWDGIQAVADIAAIAALRALELPAANVDANLAAVGAPQVWGGDGVVGALEPRLELKWM